MRGRTYHSARSAIIALLLESGALARVEIARRTGLSRSTITLAMTELLREGLVQEIGTDASTGGRRPVLVRLGGASRFVIGVAIEAEETLATLVTLDGQPVETTGVPLPRAGDVDSVVDSVVEAVRRLAGSRSPGSLLAVGLSLSGQSSARDTTFFSGVWNFPPAPLEGMLRRAIGVPSVVRDNAHAAALGELWRRGREHRAHLVYIYMGHGVGGAIIAERALYTGANQAAGEMGHVILDPHGPDFGCHRGCFEGYVSYPHLARLVEEFRAGGLETALPEVTPDDVLLPTLQAAVEKGDPVAEAVIDDAARHTGQMAANLIGILNPDEIIIGGPFGVLGESFTARVSAYAARTALPLSFASVHILPGSPVLETAALGAAAAALSQAPVLLGHG